MKIILDATNGTVMVGDETFGTPEALDAAICAQCDAMAWMRSFVRLRDHAAKVGKTQTKIDETRRHIDSLVSDAAALFEQGKTAQIAAKPLRGETSRSTWASGYAFNRTDVDDMHDDAEGKL